MNVTGGAPAVLSLRRPTTSAAADAAEPWEAPVKRRDRQRVERMLPGRPFRPSRPEDVPAGALPGLEAVCGPLALDRLYVLPRTLRLVSPLDSVISPTEVLAFGDEAVGLWIDRGDDAPLVISTPIDRLLAVEDRAILLYGRLRLLGSDFQIVARYSTVTRDELAPNLVALRARMATVPEAVVSDFIWLNSRGAAGAPADLPYKWRLILESRTTRPNPGESLAIAVGDLREIPKGRLRAASGVAVLSPGELVIATEPIDWLDKVRYGVDVLAVPRHSLDRLSWDGRHLTVWLRDATRGATSVALPLDLSLVEAMGRAFGMSVRWG